MIYVEVYDSEGEEEENRLGTIQLPEEAKDVIERTGHLTFNVKYMNETPVSLVLSKENDHV